VAGPVAAGCFWVGSCCWEIARVRSPRWDGAGELFWLLGAPAPFDGDALGWAGWVAPRSWGRAQWTADVGRLVCRKWLAVATVAIEAGLVVVGVAGASAKRARGGADAGVVVANLRRGQGCACSRAARGLDR